MSRSLRVRYHLAVTITLCRKCTREGSFPDKRYWRGAIKANPVTLSLSQANQYISLKEWHGRPRTLCLRVLKESNNDVTWTVPYQSLYIITGLPVAQPSYKSGSVFPSGTNRTLAWAALVQDIIVCVECVEQISWLQQSTFRGARSDSDLLAIYLRWKHTNANIRM